MTINKDNIKLYASQRLTDEDGRATGDVMVDDVSMRKVFMGVETDNNDRTSVPRPFSLWRQDNKA